MITWALLSTDKLHKKNYCFFLYSLYNTYYSDKSVSHFFVMSQIIIYRCTTPIGTGNAFFPLSLSYKQYSLNMEMGSSPWQHWALLWSCFRRNYTPHCWLQYRSTSPRVTVWLFNVFLIVFGWQWRSVAPRHTVRYSGGFRGTLVRMNWLL